jgi:hypothetical protein
MGIPGAGFDISIAGRGHGSDNGVGPLMRSAMKSWAFSIPWGRGLLPALVFFFVLIRMGEAQGMAPDWVRHYGDDLLCLPLVLSLVLMAQRLAAGDGRILPVGHGLMAVGAFSVFFELVLPNFTTRSVSDPVDGLMYLAGFLVFQVFINRGVAVQGDCTEISGAIFTFQSPAKQFRRNHGYL